jgi:DNA polymerase-4
MNAPTTAHILHVDLDAFYASVEQLDDPALRGRAVVVGGTGPRGVVCAASYEARTFGVHSAMPTGRARRACPHAVFLPPRFDRYSDKSKEVMAILRSTTEVVEQLSIDEAFVDAAGVRRRHGDGPQVATMLKARIRDETGLTASIGVATTKFLAKLASDMSKPDGLLTVEPGTEVAFLAPLPVQRLWGVGPATFGKLDRMGVRTIGDVAALPEDILIGALGASLGRHLARLARNEDDRVVEPERELKSIGAEETYDSDLHTHADCDRELVRLAERVGTRVRDARMAARTVTLKIRFADFETRTRSRTLAEATERSSDVLETARALVAAFDPGRGVRLLGISLSQLEPAAELQQAFAFDAADERARARGEHRAAVEHAADAVRRKFGARAVQPATLVDPEGRR